MINILVKSAIKKLAFKLATAKELNIPVFTLFLRLLSVANLKASEIK